MRVHEILFLLSGLGLLFSLLWLEGGVNFLWLLAKVFYFAGIIFFIFRKKYEWF